MSKIIKTPKSIIIEEKIRFGKPCIKGTRIAISDILLLLEGGYNVQDIPKQYPSVKLKNVKEALRYTAAILGREETLELQ